jgi:ribosomal protein S18 acetylase RimI-like enzyme
MLKEKGCEEFWGIVHANNSNAIQFFSKRGFEQGRKFYWIGKNLTTGGDENKY